MKAAQVPVTPPPLGVSDTAYRRIGCPSCSAMLAQVVRTKRSMSHRRKLPPANSLGALQQGGVASRDVFGILFCEASIIRPTGAVLLEQNDEWRLQHRSMQVEAMAELVMPANEAASRQTECSV